MCFHHYCIPGLGPTDYYNSDYVETFGRIGQIQDDNSKPRSLVSWNRGTPNSSILFGCSIINHRFGGIHILGNPHFRVVIPCSVEIHRSFGRLLGASQSCPGVQGALSGGGDDFASAFNKAKTHGFALIDTGRIEMNTRMDERWCTWKVCLCSLYYIWWIYYNMDNRCLYVQIYAGILRYVDLHL